MTHTATTSLPGTLGNAAMEGIGRGLGALVRLVWRYPLNTAGILLLTWGTTAGAVNALWMQHGAHPAPLFVQGAAALARAPVSAAQPDPGLASSPNAYERPKAAQAPGTVMPVVPAIRHTSNASPANSVVAPAQPQAAPKAVSIPDNVGNADVARLQAKLAALGFFQGKVDGYYGPETANAIRAFERRAGLAENGAISAEIERAVANAPLNLGLNAPPAAPSEASTPAQDPIAKIALAAAERAGKVVAPETAPVPAAPAAKSTQKPAEPGSNPELVSMVQSGLARLGFYAGPITGKVSQTTARAIREFENYNNYPVTGKMAPELIDMLMSAGAYN